MHLIFKIILSLMMVVNSEEAKEPVIDDFCNKKLAEYKQKVPNIITAYQNLSKIILIVAGK